jgi:hypothetical protein
MKPVAPEDRGRMLILLIAVVGVFGFAIWRVVSLSGPPPAANLVTPPPAKLTDGPTVTSTAPNGTVASGAGGGTTTLGSQLVILEPPANADLVDPFRAVLAKDESTSSPFPGAGPARSTPTPKVTLPDITPLKPGSLDGTLPTTIDAKIEPPKLSGIISGNPPIGIFTINGKDEILHVGEKTSDGYLVQSISGSSASLARGKTKVNLSVGHL